MMIYDPLVNIADQIESAQDEIVALELERGALESALESSVEMTNQKISAFTTSSSVDALESASVLFSSLEFSECITGSVGSNNSDVGAPRLRLSDMAVVGYCTGAPGWQNTLAYEQLNDVSGWIQDFEAKTAALVEWDELNATKLNDWREFLEELQEIQVEMLATGKSGEEIVADREQEEQFENIIKYGGAAAALLIVLAVLYKTIE